MSGMTLSSNPRPAARLRRPVRVDAMESHPGLERVSAQMVAFTTIKHRVEKPGSFLSTPISELFSLRQDGTDRRVHARFTNATDAEVSPDGLRVAYEEGDNIYVAPFR